MAALRAGLMFGVIAFVFGLIGTTALGAWTDTFILARPVSLYIAFRGGRRARRQPVVGRLAA